MIELRSPNSDELQAASELCLRSKAHWGYDDDFLSACADELSISEAELSRDSVTLAFSAGELAGVAQVSNEAGVCYLEKLFVAPSHMGAGVGRRLFDWSCTVAREDGASRMIVDSDPFAEPFYLAMGCRRDGVAPSGSIPGRNLPRLVLNL